jgi:hypothetical protein
LKNCDFRHHAQDGLQAMPISIRAILLVALLQLLATFTPLAHALDNDADDYSAGALPAGTNLALLYYQHVERNKVFGNGERVGNGDLTSDVGIFRLVRFVKVGPFIADPQILLPFGRLKASNELSALGDTSGVGDPIITATFWLLNKPEEGKFFGITPAVYVPIGTYDRNKALNLGEHRWRYLLQAGYVTPLFTKDLSLQLVGDVTLFGRNNDFGPASQSLSQRPLYQLQAWLKYTINPSFDVRFGVSHFTGGRTEVDGVSNENRIRTTNFKIGGAWNFAPGWNLAVHYGRDLSVHNGLEESNRLNVRLLKAF